jgi:S1-C subfamily serine protease
VEVTIGDCSGGSGVCVSPDGLVLSCRHCLKLQEGAGGVQEDGIIVAFPQHLEAPPIQAYYARILETDHERDLVLLAPLRDVFNRPLPPDLVLPWLPLGDSSALRLGEPLWVGGYPQMGSECSRTAVILSRGIVAGLERRPNGPAWIKTDAWVAPGHSGGPLVDREGRLVGIAAATLGSTESLGLAIPIGRIPANWRERIQARDKPPADDD